MNHSLIISLVWVVGLLFVPLSATAADPDPNCGPLCLYVAAASLDREVGQFEDFYERFGMPDGRGYSLGQIEAMAQSLGLKTYGVKTNAETLALRPSRYACIAWINGQHFVLVNAVEDRQLAIIDPPRTYTIPIEIFNTQWDGTALLISPDEILTDEEVLRQFGGNRRWLSVGLMVGAVGVAVTAIIKWRNHRATA